MAAAGTWYLFDNGRTGRLIQGECCSHKAGALIPKLPSSRSFDQLFFKSVAFSDVHLVKLLELVQQLHRRSGVVTVALLFGDDLTLVGKVPL